MSRSLKKGPYVDAKLLKKLVDKKPSSAGVIKTWARNSQIAPEFVGFTFGVLLAFVVSRIVLEAVAGIVF